MPDEFQVLGQNATAQFTLKLHRGDGMTLVAMKWRDGEPPPEFVGFAIEYQEPKGRKYYPLNNRLCFPGTSIKANPIFKSSILSPFQKFRWVHFPRNADIPGSFLYRVTPVFMNDRDELSYGEAQEAPIELRRETYPGQLNVAFTRGFISSQAFVERYESQGPISLLLPANADDGLTFKPRHPKTQEALKWMGFEARQAILDVLGQAVADKNAQVRVVAYDLNEPEVVSLLENMGTRLKVIIDDSGSHGEADSCETEAERRLVATAGRGNVKRQKMGKLQHNKMIIVDGPNEKTVVCGSTNFSWRGFYVQSNNAVVLCGENSVRPFMRAFDDYWNKSTPASFGDSDSASWADLGLENIDARVSFSPHSTTNALLQRIASDIGQNTTSSLLYSLAFLYQTPGPILDVINQVTNDEHIFVYGISDRKVAGIDLQKPGGNVSPVYPSALRKDLPEPFRSEPTGGRGISMHHKFVVVDFDQPTARVYLGSYNFSGAADLQNGENLLLIRDRRIAVSFAIEALRIFDHYHFRVNEKESKKAKKKLELRKPPRKTGETPWWKEYYSDPRKIRDLDIFA